MMKNIAFIIAKLNSGGAERVLSTLANDWSKERNISIIQLSDIDPFYPLSPNINLVKLPRIPSGNYVFRLFYHLQTIFLISKEMKRLNADIYISFIVGLNFFTIISSKLAGKKIITSEHNNYKALKGKWAKHLRLFLYRFSDHVTVLTQYDKKYYTKYLKKISVIKNPISFRPLVEETQREKIILCVGSLGQQKNFNHIIKCVEIIQNQLNGWKVNILGEGPLKLDLQKQIDDKKLSDIIKLKGVKKDILSWYRKSGLFVLCSLYEGFPMVLIEAMSQGLPCISYDIVSGPNEIITHNHDGILVTSQNITELSNTILSLINDDKKRYLLGQNAVKKSASLSLDNINKDWNKVFNNVCA